MTNNRTRHLIGLLAAVALLALAAGCGGEGGDEAARDHCADAGFVDGEQRSDEGELIAECRPGPTPNGGAYSIARYSDAGGPADKDQATDAEITEYDEDGEVVQTTHGTLGGG